MIDQGVTVTDDSITGGKKNMRYRITIKNTVLLSDIRDVITSKIKGNIAHIDKSDMHTTIAFYVQDTDAYIKVHALLTSGIIVNYAVSNE